MNRLRLGLALTTVVVSGWVTGAFWSSTYHSPGSAVYPVAAAAPAWVGPGDGSPEAWFRLPLSLETAAQSATMWVDADQEFRIFVDGTLAGKSNDTLAHRPSTAGFDLTPRLNAGDHVIGIRVTNHDNREATLAVRIRLGTGGQFLDFDTGHAPWRVSADPSQVDVTGLNVPTFAVVGFNDSGWRAANPTVAPRDVAPTLAPQWVLDDPLAAEVIGGAGHSPDITAESTVIIGGTSGAGWLRVAASGPFSVFLDGAEITHQSVSQSRVTLTQPQSNIGAQAGLGPSQPGGPPSQASVASSQGLTLSPGTTAPPSLSVPGNLVRLYPQSVVAVDVGPLLHSGVNRLSVHARSSTPGLIYVDGRIDGMTNGRVATGPGWTVSEAQPGKPGGARPEAPALAGVAAAVWPNGLIKVIAGASAVNAPPWVALVAGALVPLLFVITWLGLGWVARRVRGIELSVALQRDALAHLPMVTAIALLGLLGRMPNLTPPFPYTPPIFLGLIATLVVARLMTLVSSGENPLPLRSAITGLFTRRQSGEAGVSEPVASAPADSAPAGAEPGGGRARGRLLAAARRHWYGLSVGGVAVGLGAIFSYRLDYATFWQDELASLAAAQGVRAHVLPQWPSGFLYFKSELYSALIAVVGAITGDSPIPLRFLSVLWYVATIVVFGVVLVPLVIQARPWVRLAVVTLFATSPFEIVWARDLRMYQQAEFFFVLFLALYLKALRKPGVRSITLAMVSLMLMYLSHEESFIFLFAVPLVIPMALRWSWIRDRRWWLIGGGTAVLILGQYALATFTHGPSFGYDRLNAPLVAWNASDPYYYLNLVYFPGWSGSSPVHVLTFVSSLAVIATVVGVVRRSFVRLYLATFLWVPVLALTLVLSVKNGRYTFLTLPVLFLLGSMGALDVLSWIRAALLPVALTARERLVSISVFRVAAVLGGGALALTMAVTPADYGLLAARVTGVKYVEKHPDYDRVVAYMKAREQPGDLFVTLCPPNVPAYYLGRSPDYIITVHPYDRFLYLLEKNGQAVDTQYGVPQIFSARDLEHVLATHRRIWLVSDQGSYLHSVLPEVTALVQSNFRWVAAGHAASLYFRD